MLEEEIKGVSAVENRDLNWNHSKLLWRWAGYLQETHLRRNFWINSRCSKIMLRDSAKACEASG